MTKYVAKTFTGAEEGDMYLVSPGVVRGILENLRRRVDRLLSRFTKYGQELQHEPTAANEEPAEDLHVVTISIGKISYNIPFI